MDVKERPSGESAAWMHFKRTGVILPGFEDEIAARLTATGCSESPRRDEVVVPPR